MSNAFLFIVTVLIWGTSWIAIAWQVESVPVILSVFYRILLAALLLLAGLAILGRLKRPAIWRFVILQGLCLFSLNFIALYNSAALIPSGLLSVIFSMASILNAVNARLFFGERVSLRTVLAGGLGVMGVVLLFWDSLAVSFEPEVLQGIAWGGLGTMIFSWGNMASRKNSASGISPVLANAWGMGVGSIILLGLVLAGGQSMEVPRDMSFWITLVYLALFASVICFTTYLMLVARMGAAQAGYATVMFPVVALAVSTVFEGYQWTGTAVVGVVLALLGNALLFAKARAPVSNDSSC